MYKSYDLIPLLSAGRCDSAIPNFLSSPPRFLFYFRRLIVDSTIPAALLKLKPRLEDWRATRKYARQPIPGEFRQSAAEMATRYSPSIVPRILKLDPWRRLASFAARLAANRNRNATTAKPGPQARLCRRGIVAGDLMTLNERSEADDALSASRHFDGRSTISIQLGLLPIRSSWSLVSFPVTGAIL